MAIQVNQMSVIVNYVRQPDGTYVTSLAGVQASCSDPAALNPTAKAGGAVNGVTVPAYQGTQTCDAMVAAVFANAKTACGAV